MKTRPLGRPLALSLALRLLRHPAARRRQSRPMLAAIISIALSLVPLVLVLQVSDGMISGILNRYMETASSHLRFYPRPQMNDSDLEQLQQQLRQRAEFRYVGPQLEGAAMALVRGRRQAVELRGIDAQQYHQDKGFNRYMEVKAGSFQLDKGSIVVGEAIAEKLQIKVGDEITLLTAAILPGPRYLPKTKLFKVSGIVSSGYREIDKLWVFSSYQSARSFLHPSSSRQSLAIKVDNPLKIDRKLKRQLRQQLQLPTTALFLSWKDLSVSLRQNFELTRAILLLTMALIVVLALSNISSSLIMLIIENHEGIGILKACGAGRKLLLHIYLLLGIISSTVALLPGLLVGTLLSTQVNRLILLANLAANSIGRWLNLIQADQGLDLLNASYYLEQIPITIKALPLLLIALSTLVLSLLASLLPALRASRLQPLSLIRSGG